MTTAMIYEEKPGTNIPEMNVSELAFSLKKTLEQTYGRIRIRGELSRVKIHSSGHLYSDLKDENAVLNVVCWRGNVQKLSIKPEEGLEVICTGKISSYPARSNYQMIIESMELAGEGALLKMLEERKKKLAAEGLFSPDRKKALPFLPETIGIITSPTGAVIRDMMHRLNDRFPRSVLLYPALVQGPGAAEQITTAIESFNSMRERKPDILIVARGGGSLEDLMAFNEENVVRAAAKSSIPLISAVGHETDTTLIDYAADLRAPTPTAAAELAVPQRTLLKAQILDNQKRLIAAMARSVDNLRKTLMLWASQLSDPKTILSSKIQHFDFVEEKLGNVFIHYIQRKKMCLVETKARIPSMDHSIKTAHKELSFLLSRIHNARNTSIKNAKQRFDLGTRMLESLSFKSVLKRGYVVVKDSAGNIVTRASKLSAQQNIRLLFQDNPNIEATIQSTSKGKS